MPIDTFDYMTRNGCNFWATGEDRGRWDQMSWQDKYKKPTATVIRGKHLTGTIAAAKCIKPVLNRNKQNEV